MCHLDKDTPTDLPAHRVYRLYEPYIYIYIYIDHIIQYNIYASIYNNYEVKVKTIILKFSTYQKLYILIRHMYISTYLYI